MNTLRAAIVPGLIAGVVSIFTSWFWMGLVSIGINALPRKPGDRKDPATMHSQVS